MFGWRKGYIYAYSCIDPETGQREKWAYVGKTRQEPAVRHAQHMGFDRRQNRQPWSDLYPEMRIVHEFSSCPEWFLDFVEKWNIKLHFPVYNYIHNLKNPRRIPKYQAEAARLERDRRRKTLRYVQPVW